MTLRIEWRSQDELDQARGTDDIIHGCLSFYGVRIDEDEILRSHLNVADSEAEVLPVASQPAQDVIEVVVDGWAHPRLLAVSRRGSPVGVLIVGHAIMIDDAASRQRG